MSFTGFTDFITPTKYKVPTAATVDVNAEQVANAQSNTSAFQAVQGLAAQYNTFQQQQVLNQLNQSNPAFAGLEAQANSNYAKQLRGELSLSDESSRLRSSAAGNLGRGTAGSPAGVATTLRDLGLERYAVQTNAQQNLPGYMTAIAGIKKAPLFDFGGTFMSASDRIASTWKNQENMWNVQNLKNQMKAQPEPWMKALAGFGDSLTNMSMDTATGPIKSY
jgi:hypothetical protein